MNFGLAKEFGGDCHLRFDDTNPAKEDQEYIDAIKSDVHWLGFDCRAPMRCRATSGVRPIASSMVGYVGEGVVAIAPYCAIIPGFLLRVARVVKLVDAGDSKSPAARRAGSIPAPGTMAATLWFW